MNMIRFVFLIFCAFLGLVIYTADVGDGPRYWGWLSKVPLGDKLCHCGFMLTLTALANLTLKARAIRLGQIMLLLGTVIVTILVVGEECSQYWIPSRNFDLFDLSADPVGIAWGDLIARRLHRENRATA
jgi:polysaccharide biosynthesis protein VpsQ